MIRKSLLTVLFGTILIVACVSQEQALERMSVSYKQEDNALNGFLETKVMLTFHSNGIIKSIETIAPGGDVNGLNSFFYTEVEKNIIRLYEKISDEYMGYFVISNDYIILNDPDGTLSAKCTFDDSRIEYLEADGNLLLKVVIRESFIELQKFTHKVVFRYQDGAIIAFDDSIEDIWTTVEKKDVGHYLFTKRGDFGKYLVEVQSNVKLKIPSITAVNLMLFMLMSSVEVAPFLIGIY